MGFLDLFSGGSPEKHEKKADAFVINASYGHAKIEYEKALEKLDQQPISKPSYKRLIEDKLWHCKEALALEHKENGADLVEAGCIDEARELFGLALELTTDPSLTADIKRLLDGIEADAEDVEDYAFPGNPLPRTEDYEADEPGSDDEYFTALCNSLEDEEQDEYRSYPDTFKQGFIALNRGDFSNAVVLLSEAQDDYPYSTNYITLELATALMNMNDNERARELMEKFIAQYPESLKAYYLMCEILWESHAFDAAHEMLSNCPEDLAGSLPIRMLTGETLLRSGEHEAAVASFQALLEEAGWNDTVAQALARAYEALDRPDKARTLYGEIMNACTGCGAHVDPKVKQRYAETSFKTGDASTKLLELYLALSREDPANRCGYYHRISRIYSLQGNEKESRRFASFAQRFAEEENESKLTDKRR
jgi:tetratricopeptide (TPR) repeat protein